MGGDPGYGVRPIRTGDYEGSAALISDVCPDRSEDAEEWRRDDEGASDRPVRRYVAAADDGQALIGYAASRHVRLGRYGLDLAVPSAWRKRGVGSALLSRVTEDLRAAGAVTLEARALEDRPEDVAFYLGRGFVETLRMHRLRLELATADPAPFLPLLERIAGEGIEIATLVEERTHGAGWLRRLYELENAVMPDWPTSDPSLAREPFSFEDFRRRFERHEVIADGYFIAKLGDEYIGYSGLTVPREDPGRIDMAGTAVSPEHRRRGLATALKVRTIQYARERGYATMRTGTASAAMLAIIERLGFRKGAPDEIRLLRSLKAG